MKKNRLIHLLLIFPMILFAQSKAITGTVIDENKMPLPGVSILIKDLKIGSFTDFDGLFSLTVPEIGKTQVFSYLESNVLRSCCKLPLKLYSVAFSRISLVYVVNVFFQLHV